MIKRIIFVLIVIFVTISTIYAIQPPAISQDFIFDKTKIDNGNMYHYIATDINGNSPVDTYIYVKSIDTLIIYYAYNTNFYKNFLVLETVKFNWDHMMAQEITAVNPLNPKSIDYLGASTKANFAKKAIVFKESSKNYDFVALDHYQYEPCYTYEDFHIDLQFALRFLKDPKGHVKITDYYNDQTLEALVHYCNDEKINGINCRKYEMRRAGVLGILSGIKAYFWITNDDSRHYTIKYINYEQRFQKWTGFKFELIEIKRMNPNEWDYFINSMIAHANSRL